MKPVRPLVTHRRTALAVIGLALLVIGGYTLYAALPLILGPHLSIAEPTGSSVAGTTVVRGTTARVSFLTIDGLPIALDEDGSFSVERAYPPGYTEVTIAAKDRFGREIVRTVPFIIVPPPNEATTTHA